jgi:hypothetical protein
MVSAEIQANHLFIDYTFENRVFFDHLANNLSFQYDISSEFRLIFILENDPIQNKTTKPLPKSKFNFADSVMDSLKGNLQNLHQHDQVKRVSTGDVVENCR